MTQDDTTAPEPLGERLKRLRTDAHLTQEELAYRVHDVLPKGRRPGASVISRIENGKIVRPEPYVVAAIATAIEVSLEELAPEYVEEVAMIASVLRLVRTTRDQGDAMHTWIPISPDWNSEHPGQHRRAS